MNPLRVSLLHGTVLALAAICGLQCAKDAQAQAASPPPGKALVVLYRADRQPVAGRVPVIANADRLGEVSNGEFVNAVVNPGRTFLRAGDRILTTLSLQAAAGQTYYVLIEAVPGQSPLRVEMREMTQGAARSALSQSRAAAPAAVAKAGAAAAPAPAPRAPAAAPAPLAATPAASPPPRPAPAPAPAPQRQAQASPPPRAAPPPPRERPREPTEDNGAEWRFAVIAKTGVFKLGSTSQSVSGGSITYDKSAKPVAAVEAELRHRDGYALGAEVFYYKNAFSLDTTTLKGDQTVISGTLNAKYYFAATSWLYPFLGVGLGYAGASYGGDFTGTASSFAFQGMAGADIRFSDSVGLYIEFKLLNAPVRDKNQQEFKAGGNGILAGLSFAF